MKPATHTQLNRTSGKLPRVKGEGRNHRVRAESQPESAWRLPGGMRLAEFALRGGFVASTLLARRNREG